MGPTARAADCAICSVLGLKDTFRLGDSDGCPYRPAFRLMLWKLSEIPTDTKKQKKGDGNNTIPVARNLKQKEGLSDLWRLLENVDFNSLFGNNSECNALVAKKNQFQVSLSSKEREGL